MYIDILWLIHKNKVNMEVFSRVRELSVTIK